MTTKRKYDGREVRVKKDECKMWRMQSADNFKKLGERAPAERPARAEGEEKKELTGGWWEAGKGEGYPPGLGGVCQKEARVGACVRVDNGVHWWSDLEIGSLDEYKIWAAALEKKYPKYQSLDKHWCELETVQYRTAQCMQARDYCWNKLDRDTLGNGGCSVQTNFAGVQWGANNKKRDKIIQGMDLGPECASKLQVGLSPGAFVTLFMFCDQLLPHTRSSRQNVRALQDRAVYFLRGSPMVAQAKDISNTLATRAPTTSKSWANAPLRSDLPGRKARRRRSHTCPACRRR